MINNYKLCVFACTDEFMSSYTSFEWDQAGVDKRYSTIIILFVFAHSKIFNVQLSNGSIETLMWLLIKYCRAFSSPCPTLLHKTLESETHLTLVGLFILIV